MQKNVSGQRVYVYAYDITSTSGDPSETGDAANITAQISKDGGAAAATNDTNPTELDATDHPGVYYFDLTQTETNAEEIVITAKSSTSNVLLDRVVIYTRPANFPDLGIESDGDLTKVNTLDGHTAQTGDSYARIGDNGAGLSAVPWNASWDSEVESEVTDALTVFGVSTVTTAQVNSEVDTALSDYDPPTKAELDAGFAALNDLSAAQVNAEVDTALADIHLDHLLATNYDPSSKPGTATALLNELVENDEGVSRFTSNALEQGPIATGFSTHSAADVADAVWDEAQADHVDAGSFGETASEIALILTDTGTTLPGTLTIIEGKIDTVDDVADSILVDTGTTLPATLGTIDGKIDTIDGLIDAILVDTGTTLPGLIAALNDIAASDVITALGSGTEVDGKSYLAAIRYIASICAGKVSGAKTGKETFVGLDGATDRVVVTVDGDGNRTGVSYDP